MKIILFIVICYFSSTVSANEFDEYLNNYDKHQSNVKKLEQKVELYELQSKAQNLKTKLQKSKLECQKFGGCETKTLYTPPAKVDKTSGQRDKQAQDNEGLSGFVNKPLPLISAINAQSVNFDNSPQVYRQGDLVYGVWLVGEITATTVELLNKDSQITTILYFYWK